MARMSSRKGTSRLTIGIVAIGLLAAAAFVPVRTCERCRGIAGFKVGDAIDLRCNGCGGKGKQTVLDIGIAAVRK